MWGEGSLRSLIQRPFGEARWDHPSWQLMMDLRPLEFHCKSSSGRYTQLMSYLQLNFTYTTICGIPVKFLKLFMFYHSTRSIRASFISCTWNKLRFRNKSNKIDRSSRLMSLLSKFQWINQQKQYRTHRSPTFAAFSPGRHRLARGRSLWRERSRWFGAREVFHRRGNRLAMSKKQRSENPIQNPMQNPIQNPV